MQGIHIVIMGVAGCGKSEIGQRLAALLGVPLIEGDTFHSPVSVAKMRDGVPLTDADREGWLRMLGEQLSNHAGAVMTCSALRRTYRDALRGALNLALNPTSPHNLPPLNFLFLNIDEATAQARVAARADHFYPVSLVASQFATLEDPSGEPDVLTLAATLPPDDIAARTAAWLQSSMHTQQATPTGEFNEK